MHSISRNVPHAFSASFFYPMVTVDYVKPPRTDLGQDNWLFQVSRANRLLVQGHTKPGSQRRNLHFFHRKSGRMIPNECQKLRDIELKDPIGVHFVPLRDRKGFEITLNA